MTDAEISRALALAIGWPESEMWNRADFMVRTRRYSGYDYWRVFDYRDPAVIWPIAERYNAFPRRWRDGLWVSINTTAHTAAEAVALAVIGGKA